tara:strand:- start:226 stop:708 length:483 start_codon:yes stop_codon:yes gene_type:complete
MLISIVEISIICWFLNIKIDPSVSVKPSQRQVIGGWVILFAIGNTITPLELLVQITTNDNFYLGDAAWKILFSTNVKFGFLGISETIFNSSYLVFFIFIILLFYQKRSSAPRMIIIMYAVVCIFQILDNVHILQLAPENYTASEKQEIYLEVVKLFLELL